MFGAATDSGIVFVGRNRKQGGKKLMTRIVRTHEIKTDLFFNNFNCTWSLQNEGEETLVVEDLDCNLSTMCVYVCVIVSKCTTATT